MNRASLVSRTRIDLPPAFPYGERCLERLEYSSGEVLYRLEERGGEFLAGSVPVTEGVALALVAGREPTPARPLDAADAAPSPEVAFEVSYEEGVEFHHERFATLAEAERRERELLEMGLLVIGVFEVDADDG